MKTKVCCPSCGGPLILHRVGNYADDYYVDETGKISARRKKRNIYPTDPTWSTVFCGRCYETYTDFWIDKDKRIILFTEK